MDDVLVPVLVPIVVVATLVFGVVAISKVISDGRTLRRLIERSTAPELTTAITTAMRQDPALYDSLRWALVIGAVGLALIVIQFLPYTARDPIVYGLVLVFAAGGLFAYYAAARRMTAR